MLSLEETTVRRRVAHKAGLTSYTPVSLSRAMASSDMVDGSVTGVPAAVHPVEDVVPLKTALRRSAMSNLDAVMLWFTLGHDGEEAGPSSSSSTLVAVSM